MPKAETNRRLAFSSEYHYRRLTRQFSQCYSVGPIRWVLIKQECFTQLDGVAEAIIEKKVMPIHKLSYYLLRIFRG